MGLLHGKSRGKIYSEVNIMKKIGIRIGVFIAILMGVFFLGRYGWKLSGFTLCEDVGIEQVEVQDNAVHIVGFDPGSFPRGFCGYYAKEEDGILYVGFRYSLMFGLFESSGFDITIPTKGNIKAVVLKTETKERVLLEREGVIYE